MDELEHEKVKMDQIMQEARDYIEKIELGKWREFL